MSALQRSLPRGLDTPRPPRGAGGAPPQGAPHAPTPQGQGSTRQRPPGSDTSDRDARRQRGPSGRGTSRGRGAPGSLSAALRDRSPEKSDGVGVKTPKGEGRGERFVPRVVIIR